MRKQFGDYYLGLDIGTGSVGWAVTDTDYNVLKFNGKAMWGARLFDTAETAANTRVARAGRRRLERQRQRIKYLQEFFAEEISKVDPGFFMRMQESNLQHNERIETQQSKGKYHSIFNDAKYTDSEYYSAYPTIYHLRKALIDGEKLDVRLVYLAIKHILNHRGHFLLDGELDAVDNFDIALNELNEYLSENFGEDVYLDVPAEASKELQNILKNKTLSRSKKKEEIISLLNLDKKNKQMIGIVSAICGLNFKLNDVLADDSIKDEETGKDITTDLGKLEDDKYEELAIALGDSIAIIDKLKAIYNWSLLSEILAGAKYISYAKVKTYDEHQNDLRILKNLLSSRNLHEKKKAVFSYTKGSKDANYSSYIGMCNKNGRKAVIEKRCNYDDFCSFLKKQLAGITDLSEQERELITRIDTGCAFPIQTVKNNGVIPMQLQKAELCAILDNAKTYLPFLNEKDANGLSIADKIMEVFTFRVPYYVGPLNGTAYSKEKGRCWVVRSMEKVTPWNFRTVVDEEKSAENFISKMTNKCTYLIGEDVLPKNSLLYTEFVVRNEINNIRVNGERLDSKSINRIYDELVLKARGKITIKHIKDFLKNNGAIGEVSGIDIALNSSLKVFRDFYGIFGESYVNSHRDVIENLIKWITLFGDEPRMLVNKIKKEYPKMDLEKINRVKKLKYKDWGRLSKTLLESEDIAYLDSSTGELVTVISALRNTNKNFMELIEGDTVFDFKGKIKAFNTGSTSCDNALDYAYLDSLYVSPAVKREIWQTILIVKEIKKITGHAPKKIFVEMARGKEDSGRTVSRKQRLLDLYKNCKKEAPELFESLNGCTEEDLRRNVLYLYYTQLGKDMYTGKPINIAELSTNYDKDHIYPRSKTKDDSILNNLVLVNRTDNARKTDVYPLPKEVQEKMHPFWDKLKEKGFITAEKYKRLTRTSPLSDEELASFINRQLVETRQSTKVVAEIFNKAFPDTRVVYSKAGNVSDFRQIFDFVKCREINDLHHAKDAYLNIVVGNVYDTKFTSNPLNFIKSKQEYSLNTEVMFKYWDVEGAWKADKEGKTGSIATVRKYMTRNNILVTWMQYEGHGQIFNLTLMKKGKGQIPVKKDLPIEAYGGYNSASTGYFVLVESIARGKKIRTLEMVPIYKKKSFESLENKEEFFKQAPYELEKPRIIVEKILLKSKISMNGWSMIITGKTGDSILGHLADELLVGESELRYIAKIGKFLGRKAKYRDAMITKFDAITSEKNLELYKYFLEKHKSDFYKNRPSGQIKNLEKGMDKFTQLALEDQAFALNEILKLFVCKPGTVDLKIIGASGRAGSVKFSKNITNNASSVQLVNYSVTGLFQQEIDLLKI